MRFTRFTIALCAVLLTSFAPFAAAWNRSPATQFATLPAGTAHPEGIAADARGNLYVANFDVSGNTTVGTVVVFDRNGRWLRTLQLDNGSTLLLGIGFNPVTHDLLVADLGKQQMLKVDPQSGASSVFASIPGGPAAGPNGLAFDAAGNVYISDSFQATIWRTPPGGGVPVPWVTHDLLGTTGVPPFGANGMAFNRNASALFVANTGNDTIVRIPLPGGPSGVPGTPEVFVNSINGADGVIVDAADNLWVVANQADEIVVVDPTGRGLFGAPTVDSQWTAEVTQYTIARIHAHLPPIRGQ